MARYLAVYYFLDSKSHYFPIPKPSHVPLQSPEPQKAWEEAVTLLNQSYAGGATTPVDKIEIYQLVYEQTNKDNQRQGRKRKPIVETIKSKTKPFAIGVIPQVQPA